jgi:hypothetical protein
MNTFEKTFFRKYVAKWQEVVQVFHRHPIKIIDDIALWLGLGVLIPVFLYYNSYLIQETIEFKYFEIYLFLVYITLIYKIFDWYCDVLILTKSSITKLEWSIFRSNSGSVDYKHIEWVEVDKNGFLDTILRKWDINILKFWDEQIVFNEAYNPYAIVNKIEEISNTIEPEEEFTRFDLVMDALGWIVENYLWKTRDEDEKENISEQLKKEFLKNVEKKDGTIDLR